MNIHKRFPLLDNIMKDYQYSTKVRLFFSTKTAGDDFDPYEKNYTISNLNPQTIKGYVRDVKPETLLWKQYGLHETGAKEVVCDDRYYEWFKNCRKIEIDGDSFVTIKDGVSDKALIIKTPFKLMRAVVFKA